MKPSLFFHVAATFLFLPVTLAFSADFHVSPSGKDANAGTSAAPFQSIAAARDAARKLAGKNSVTVHVSDGTYYLPETLVFTPADSGSEKHPVIYQAENEGKAVISGGMKLDLKWQPYKDGILMASTPPGLLIDQVFINGKRQIMARYPNYDPAKTTAAYQGFAADAFSKEHAAKWTDPAGGYIHAMHAQLWGGYHYRITGKNADGTVAYEGGWQNNRQMGMHKTFRMVENIFEELDAPGEWFHNAKTHTLYYMPEPGVNPATATVEVVRLRQLIEFKGTSKEPVRFITLKGFTYRHAARTFMDTKEPLLRSDWTIFRGGAVFLTGTENVGILDSEFDQPGGNAVFISYYNRHALIKGCHIHDAGASGVCFVGDPDAVRSPLFEYGHNLDSSKIDLTPGPKTDNYPADCAVEDCLIHGIGRVERQPAGVEISMSSGISVRDCSIYDCARAGINIGDGCWGGHLVERCDIFDTVQETSDHGSFNSWGRDRYWTGNKVSTEALVKQHPEMPYLDVMKPNILRDSRWRCDHGWDIDLDDGSTNYQIYNNLLLNGGLKFREGYRRKAWNNVIVNNGFHPHVWYDACESTFTGNIAMKAHADIGMPAGWGNEVDRNFFTSEAALRAKQNAGCDINSLSGDPLFVDPASGDFRVRDNSPALKTGFKNFPMDQFGVKKPSLKALAKTPEIPPLMAAFSVSVSNKPAPVQSPNWLGAKLHGIEGEEFSAFGTSREDGGVQLTNVPANSFAAKVGLLPNDLLQLINEITIKNTGDLFKALIKEGQNPIRLRLVRNQKSMALDLKNAPFIVTESAKNAEGFSKLALLPAIKGRLSSNPVTNNDPLPSLLDGMLAKGFGPIFGNGVSNGAYKLDLRKSTSVAAITAWSFNQEGLRGSQSVTLYGSDSVTDPGWNTDDAGKFTSLGSIDAAIAPGADFLATSLRAATGTSLGSFRWIVWKVLPDAANGGNTAFQEFAVENVR